MADDIILEKKELTHLQWTRIRHSSGTAGSLLKAYDETSDGKIYYKLSGYNQIEGITGHECINEIIAGRLMSILNIEHLEYQLIHADVVVDDRLFTTYLCASKDFKKLGESKIALDAYYYVSRNTSETMMDFCIRKGWADIVYKMIIADYLLLNRDRHGANMEILVDKKKHTMRMVPLFDHGLSLLFSCRNDKEAEEFDVMADRKIQCCVGTDSALENLNLIPEDCWPDIRELKESDRLKLFDGLEGILTEKMMEKIWEMIWERWCVYENICNNR